MDSALTRDGIGWHYETGVQLLWLILSGVFDPFPHAQIIAGHWGEVVLVGRLAAAFARQAARATLRLTPLTGTSAAEQLDRGAIDVAIAHLGTLPTHFESILLLRDPFVVVARRGHPMPGKTCRSKPTRH